jgi:aminopeptidase N
LLEKLPSTQPLSWWIPFNFVVENNPDFSKTTPDGWMPQLTNTITLQPNAAKTWTNDEWIIFNKQQTGYYRVNYDKNLWLLIANELVEGDYTKIHLLNRAQLIDDAYNSARVNTVTYDIVFSLMEYLSKELDYVPWVPANRVLTLVDRMMASTDSYEHFRVFHQDFCSLQLVKHKIYSFPDFCPSHGSTDL